jgi:hypothetical protein
MNCARHDARAAVGQHSKRLRHSIRFDSIRFDAIRLDWVHMYTQGRGTALAGAIAAQIFG